VRGRLIQRFVAVLRRLDAAATAAVAGGGFDALFGEIAPVDDGTQVGAPSRRELAALRVACQLDRDPDMGRAVQTRGGAEQRVDLVLTLHRRDLEVAGLLDAAGAPLIYAGDRLEQIETLRGALVRAYPAPPGMYVHDVEEAGYGLAAFAVPTVNLFTVTLRPDQQGQPL